MSGRDLDWIHALLAVAAATTVARVGLQWYARTRLLQAQAAEPDTPRGVLGAPIAGAGPELVGPAPNRLAEREMPQPPPGIDPRSRIGVL
jgi:hypothetical protein